MAAGGHLAVIVSLVCCVATYVVFGLGTSSRSVRFMFGSGVNNRTALAKRTRNQAPNKYDVSEEDVPNSDTAMGMVDHMISRILQSQTIQEEANKFLHSPLPPKRKVSKSQPLVFFAQRNAGDAALTDLLSQASKEESLSIASPGKDVAWYGGKSAAVYIGPVDWMEVSRTFARRNKISQESHAWHGGNPDFSCMTNFQDPLARIQSCYYRQLLKQGAPACLADLEPERMREFFHRSHGANGYSCMNEPFRLMSGLVHDYLFDVDASTEEWNFVFRSTLQNLARCVPIIVEDVSTLKAAASWFPMLSEGADNIRDLVQEIKNESLTCKLSEPQLDVLRSLTAHEQRLYDLAVERARQFLPHN